MKRAFFVLASFTAVLPGFGGEAASPWRPVREIGLPRARAERVLEPRGYRTLALDRDMLFAILDQAPVEMAEPVEGALAPDVVLPLPMPDGRMALFRIQESPILAPDLAALHPEIRTYAAQGIDDPTATARFGWTSQGFHAIVLSPQGTAYIDPWARGDTRHYVSYDTKAYRRRTPTPFRCSVTGRDIEGDTVGAELRGELGAPAPAGPFGTLRRTYELALAATAEYTQAVGDGDPSTALAEMTLAINRVNAIYEREVSIHLNLIDNASIIYTNAVIDPYTNNDGPAMLAQNQSNLDAVILSANYDIGHVFSTGGGGVAGLGVVCDDAFKAYGVTGSPDPTGDAFYVDYVAHEMGHQFGANHTFNGTALNCGGGNRNGTTAYEPGSGSTIMSYAGICGSQDIQLHSDDYFHGKSIDEIVAYLRPDAGASCATSSANVNLAPDVNAGVDHTIPKQTPFTLTVASSSDGNGDALIFNWEEFDLGTASPPDNDVSAVRPIFRSFAPTTSTSRTFPRLVDILNPPASCTSRFECLPTRGRPMDFRVTVRDSHFQGGLGIVGGTDSDITTVSVDGTAGPFKVTSPNTNVAWPIGSTQTVTWDVAGTGGGTSVNCANVALRLSTDGGSTFPITLLPSTPNTGSADVSLPSLFTSQARIKLDSSACSNIFFDISDANFTIAAGVAFTTANQAVIEGNAGTTPVSFTVTLTPASSQQVTVPYATAAGSTNPATAGTDYVTASGTLTFAVGVTTQTITVNVKGDTTYERDETFLVKLTGATNAGVTDGQRTVTITNDDAPPAASINDVALLEGNTGTRNAVFTVSLSAVSGVQATVNYATADGTATLADNDYQARSGTLTFTPGSTSRTLAVPIVGNTVFEGGNEDFFVNLTAGSADVTLADSQGKGTIIEDDQAGTFQFAAPAYTVSEASKLATIKVIRTDGLAGGVSVDYEISAGSASQGLDYTGSTSGTLSFGASQTFTTFAIPIAPDFADEPNETVLLRLLNPLGPLAALGAQRTAVLTITDNDAGGKVALSAAAYTVNEAGTATITVRRSGGLASGVSVDFATSDGTAVAGTDYTGVTTTLSFGANETTRTVAVPTLAVAGPQGNKTVNITLSNATGGATLGTPNPALLTIVDDAPSVQFSAASYSVSEAAVKATISARRTGPLASQLTVDYSDAGGGSATPGSDYDSPSGTLTFLPGVAIRTFTVTLHPDTAVEGNETVNLALSSPSAGAAVGTPGTAVLTITNNDPQQYLQFTAAAYNVSEAAARAIVTVRRTGSTVGTVNVDYMTAVGGTAADGLDYTGTSGTLTFGPGVATRTFPVTVLPDTLDEGTETVNLALGNPQGGALVGSPSTAVLNILDNEPTVQFSAAKYTVGELSAKALITVRRTGSTAGTAMVDYSTAGGGTATDGSDYTGTSGTLTFAPGIAALTFSITLTPDFADEPNETVNLALANPSGVALGTPATAVLTINDNDTAGKVQFSLAASSVDEQAGTATITVTRSGGTAYPATVDYATSDGTALAGTHYTSSSGTLTFGQGQNSRTFTVPIINFGPVPPAKYLNLTLSSPGGGLILGTQSTAVLWIVID